MSRLLNWFRHTSPSPRSSASAARSVRPQLESLEDRWLPSAVSTISWNNGQPCSDVYAIDANTRQVIDIHTDGNSGAMTYNMLGGPTNVTAVSASFLHYDNQNAPMVFA